MSSSKLDKLPEVLDLVSQGRIDTEIGQILSISTRALQIWKRRSEAGDPELICTWAEVEDQYCNHRRSAIHQHASLVEQRLRRTADQGTERVLTWQGRISWVEDEKVVAMTPAEREALGFVDTYKRDKFGNRIPQTVIDPPPVQLMLRVVESFFPNTYRPVSNQNVNVKVGGVLKLGAEQSMKTIDGQVVPAIEVTPVESPAQITDQSGDALPVIAVAAPATDDAQFEEWNKGGGFDHAPVEFERADGTITQEVHKPVPPSWQKELDAQVARVAAAKDKGAPPAAVPLPKELKPHPDDDVDDVTGKPVKAAPVDPGAAQAKIDEVKARQAAGQHLTARDIKILECVAEPDDAAAQRYLRELLGLGVRSDVDNVGKGGVIPGGEKVNEPVHLWGRPRRTYS